MSRQTTEAQAIAREAESEWRMHLGGCPRCAAATKRGGRPQDRCQAGRDLQIEAFTARKAARRSAELDRQPAPDQAMLPGMPRTPPRTQGQPAGRGRRPEGKRGAARGGGRR